MSLLSLSTLFASLRDRVEHDSQVYDWWSTHQRIYALFVRVAFLGRDRVARERALSALCLDPGDAVCDVGCGAGVNFDALSRRVGFQGTIVGLDYSEGMVRAAHERASDTSTPATVVRGDATRLPFPNHSFDAAYATLSLSAMGNPETAIEEISRVLRPGGRVAVVDARPFQESPWNVLNPIVNPISTLATNWHPEADIVETIRRTFADSTLWTTNAGTLYVVTARKEADR